MDYLKIVKEGEILMPRQSKYNKEEKDNVKSYQYKATIYKDYQ